MSKKINRRSFLKKSVLVSTGAVAGLGFEEKGLLAKPSNIRVKPDPSQSTLKCPMGKIGDVEISRIICGGNLFGGGAHARDLVYVSSLMRNYFTREKVFETLELCEETGVNMWVSGPGAGRFMKRYWDERGGNIQWLSQLRPKSNDLFSAAKRSVDTGAVGGFVMGAVGDRWVRNQRTDLIGEVCSYLKQNGLIAGVAGHSKNVLIECEKAGLDIDFYFKTFHSDNYWSATPREKRVEYAVDSFGPDDNDNMWELFPDITTEFMKKVEKPWVAYKVLAAGAFHPREGFRFAFENGADFACVGMFDYQVVEDITIAKEVIADLEKSGRERPWRG